MFVWEKRISVRANTATVLRYLGPEPKPLAEVPGDHQIKGGVQIDLRGNNINSGDLAQTLTLNWASQYSDTAPQGAFGYYSVRSNGVLPRQGFITQGNVSSNVYGLFVQDAWTATNKLTINLGVRTEKEKVPAYTSSNNAYGTYPIQFGFGNVDAALCR